MKKYFCIRCMLPSGLRAFGGRRCRLAQPPEHPQSKGVQDRTQHAQRGGGLHRVPQDGASRASLPTGPTAGMPMPILPATTATRPNHLIRM